MSAIFYISSAVAVLATILVITRANAVHALLYLAVSLLAVAMVFLTFGAPFAAALEVIIYAGAIVILFIFVVMMLNQGDVAIVRERAWLKPAGWIGPGVLTLILLGELLCVVFRVPRNGIGGAPLEPRAIGVALFGPYVIGVEMASLLLLAGLIAAFHLGRESEPDPGTKGTCEKEHRR